MTNILYTLPKLACLLRHIDDSDWRLNKRLYYDCWCEGTSFGVWRTASWNEPRVKTITKQTTNRQKEKKIMWVASQLNIFKLDHCTISRTLLCCIVTLIAARCREGNSGTSDIKLHRCHLRCYLKLSDDSSHLSSLQLLSQVPLSFWPWL